MRLRELRPLAAAAQQAESGAPTRSAEGIARTHRTRADQIAEHLVGRDDPIASALAIALAGQGAAAHRAASDDPCWGGFVAGDLVEVLGVGAFNEWELIKHTRQPGLWHARACGTDDYADLHADRITLSLAAELVDDPFSEDAEPFAPSHEQIVAYLDALTEQERRALAGPFPMRWLYPWREGEPKRALNLFAGTGGWCTALRRVLGGEIDMVCLDLNRDAVATSTAAGCTAVRIDVRLIDPWHWALRWTRIVICSSPCTDWTRAGKQLGHLRPNIEMLLSAIADAGAAAGNVPATGVPGGPIAYTPGGDLTWDEVREALAEMTAPTAGLMLEPLIFALGLQHAGAPVETVAIEQSQALPQDVRDAVWAEFEIAQWAHTGWLELDAADYGSPSHRRRWFHLASRHPLGDDSAELDAPMTTLASQALGRPPELEVITRGNRRTSGGNAFTLGRVIPGVTSRIRCWDVGERGERFSLSEIALLVGMPPDHPLVGSRTSASQQLADIVNPGVGSAVLGVLLGLDWRAALRRYLCELYPTAHALDPPSPSSEPPAPRQQLSSSGMPGRRIAIQPTPTPRARQSQASFSQPALF